MTATIVISNIFKVRAKADAPALPTLAGIKEPKAPVVPALLEGRGICCENEKDCQTWHNRTWINRESYYSWKLDCWMWRTIASTSAARTTPKLEPTQGSLTTRNLTKADTEMDAKWDRAMQNWSEEEVAELLGH